MKPNRAKYARRLCESKGYLAPLQRKLLAKKQSYADAAELLGVKESAVKGWLRAVDARRIPLEVAERIEDIWGLPATDKNWPGGIRK